MSTTQRRAERARLEEEGVEAFLAGRRRTQSPYRQGSSDDRDWRHGWDRAEREAAANRQEGPIERLEQAIEWAAELDREPIEGLTGVSLDDLREVLALAKTA